MHRRYFSPLLPALFGFLALTGCSIKQSVDHSQTATMPISRIYVEANERVHMEGLLPEIVTQLEDMGYAVETYPEGERPSNAVHYMTFTANWRWDMAMYLYYFRAMLFEKGVLLGEAEYDASMGGMSFDKFGRTADKVRPLLEGLLNEAEAGSSANVMGN